MESFDYTFKVVVVGNAKVGKTNLVNLYIGKQFNVDTPSTIGVEFATKLVTTRSNQRVKIQLWDSGGNERYRVVAKSYYRGAQGYVLVYDVTDRASFLALEQFLRETKESSTEEVSVIIVGNKSDETLRVVSTEEGQEFADQHNALFIETSAKTGQNVNLVFEQLIDTIIAKTHPKQAPQSPILLHEERLHLTVDEIRPMEEDHHAPIDEVFGDLENMFNVLGHFLFVATCHRSHYEQESFSRKLLYMLPRFLPRVLIFLFLSIMSFLVILPSFFWLLVLRSKTVEIDTEDFETRQDVLSTESKLRKSVRWLSIVLRSVPMNIFLVALPILIVFVFIPLSSTPETRWRSAVALIGIYLLAVVGFQVLGTIRKARSVELQEAKTPQRAVRFRWQNYRNWISILLLLIDFVQLATWPLQQIRGQNQEPTPEDQADSFFKVMRNNVFPAFFLNLSNHLFEATFYFAVGAVLLLVLLFTYQLMLDVIEFYRLKQTGSNSEANDYFFYSFVGTVVYGHGQLKNANNKLCAAISFLADGAFLIVCNKLLMTIACTSANTLLPDSSMVCWEGTHKAYAVISLVLFAYYVPLCVMIAPIFMHSGQDEKDICFSESYVMTLTTMKCVMLIFSVFFSQTASGMILASVLVSLVLFVATLIWALRAHNLFTEPSTFPIINMFKIASFFAALWCGCVALAATQTDMADGMLLLLSGAGVFGALVVLLFMWGGFNLRKKTMYVLADDGLAPTKHVELSEAFTIE